MRNEKLAEVAEPLTVEDDCAGSPVSELPGTERPGIARGKQDELN